VAKFKVLFRYSPGWTEENQEKRHVADLQAEIEHGSFRIRSKTDNHLTTAFGNKFS
jgi:hypothetical protein